MDTKCVAAGSPSAPLPIKDLPAGINVLRDDMYKFNSKHCANRSGQIDPDSSYACS